MKKSKEIVKWGVIKPFLDKEYKFNSIDIETINNDLFLFGYVDNNIYNYVESDFYNTFNNFLISCVQTKHDILTWSRYDNTHLLKLLLKDVECELVDNILLRIGKVTPIYEYVYNNYNITIVNIIKDSMILKNR